MLYIIENISNEDITINNGILKPTKETTINNIELFIDLIKDKKLKIKSHVIDNNLYIEHDKTIVVPEIPVDFISHNIKQQLMEGFFKLYMNEELNDTELNMLKWFYKDIGLTKDISKSTFDLLENASNKEELIEVLLNNIYSELLDKHFNKHQRKNK